MKSSTQDLQSKLFCYLQKVQLYSKKWLAAVSDFEDFKNKSPLTANFLLEAVCTASLLPGRQRGPAPNSAMQAESNCSGNISTLCNNLVCICLKTNTDGVVYFALILLVNYTRGRHLCGFAIEKCKVSLSASSWCPHIQAGCLLMHRILSSSLCC